MATTVQLREYVVSRKDGATWSVVGVFMASSAARARKQAGEDTDLAGRIYRARLANAYGK